MSPFCPQCGSPADAASRFCSRCGSPLVPVSRPAAWVEPGEIKSGFLTTTTYALVVTAQRLVFVRVSNVERKETSRRAFADAKGKGKDATEWLSASNSAVRALYAGFAAMDAGMLLQTYPESFAVERSAVQECRFEPSYDVDDVDGNCRTIPPALLVSTNGRTIRFSFEMGSDEATLKLIVDFFIQGG